MRRALYNTDMIDFSKIFDIVFASVGVALILFLLVSTIAVAARGKRKCGGFDVVLRIVSTLVLIVAAVMFTAAILTMLSGSFRIYIDSPSAGKTVAYLVMNGKQTELPLVDLFIVLSSVVGSNLVAMLLVCALAALIVDCVVANKNDGKAKAEKPAKTPEQLKREAELERIKRIGESAVRKADAAASQDTATTEERDDEPQTDWREDPKAQEEHTEFVGIKEETTDDFDSFDEVAREDEQAQTEEPEEQTVLEDEPAEEEVAAEEEFTDEEALFEEEFADEQVEEEEVVEDEFVEEDVTDDEYIEQEPVESEPTEEFVEDEPVEQEPVEEPVEESEEDDMSGWAYESDEAVTDEQTEAEDDSAEQEVAEDQSEESEQVAEADEPVDDIEPDRNIYIPEMRTIEPAPKKPADGLAQSAKKPSATPKPKPAAKPKKPAAKKQKAIPPEKKLPVTRKYVILDRHNAVNMFGEYLKERNKAQKEKLESSIDTIIIE